MFDEDSLILFFVGCAIGSFLTCCFLGYFLSTRLLLKRNFSPLCQLKVKKVF